MELKEEGVVFKKKDAPYTPGRPNSNGPQLKYKFTESATCLVSAHNEKRSVALVLWDTDGVNSKSCGNVTIPPNFAVPAVGQLVEIRYLYCGAGGNLYQPVYLGVRDDKTEADLYSSLKFKQETEEDEA